MLALITGANRGIGRSAALQLAREGVDIVLTYRTHADEAAAVVAEIEALGRTARALPLDTGDVASFPAFVAELGDTRIDYLVNNAGMSIGGAFGEVDEADFDRLVDVIQASTASWTSTSRASSSSPRRCSVCSPTAGRSSTSRPA